MLMGFERVKFQQELDSRRHISNNNQLEETIRATNFLNGPRNFNSRQSPSPSKETNSHPISNGGVKKNLVQLMQ